MQALFTHLTVGISEFKKNPGATLRKAKGSTVAVLSHNEPSFYVVQPEVMQRLADELADKDFTALIQSRRTSAAAGKFIEVDVGDL
ncbi:MAG: type II toxin-antitoxin system Phd/YefM family antitoxin [Burkholderiaceae bacterium]|nr:type II toxin-antitoxin system Phd/YefM family antitoxin [Burkholderiaceae bacterium]